MAENPLFVVFNILAYIILSFVQLLGFLLSSMKELFLSLVSMSQRGFIWFIIASVIGGVFLYLIFKFVYKGGKSVIKIALLFVVFMIFIIVLMLFS